MHARQIFRRDRRPGAESLASCARRVRMRSVSRARRAAMRASAICSRGSTAAVSASQRVDGAGLHGEIAGERAHRIAHEERVLADMGDAAAGRRMLQMRNPRHVGIEHDDQIGVGEQRARLEAEMHRVARRQADGARIMRDDRNGAALGEMRERRRPRRRQRGGDDQRPLGRGDPFGERRDRCADRDASRPPAGAASPAPIGSASGADSGSRGSTR